MILILFLFLRLFAGYILKVDNCYGVLTRYRFLIYVESCWEKINSVREISVQNSAIIAGVGITEINSTNSTHLQSFATLHQTDYSPNEILRFSEDSIDHLVYAGIGDSLAFEENDVPLFMQDLQGSDIVFIGFSKLGSLNFLPRIPTQLSDYDIDEEHQLSTEIGLYATNFDNEDPCRLPTYTNLDGENHVSIEFIALENAKFHCVWNVISETQTTVEVTMKHLNIPASKDCSDAEITIYDGIDGFYPLLEICSGTSTSFLLTGDAFRVEFLTKKLGMLPSFTIEIKEDKQTKELSNCGSKKTITEASFINSINFPKLYFPNTRCTWNFLFPLTEMVFSRRWIVIHFLQMNLEERTQDKICKDSLHFYSYSERKENLLAIFCGQELSGKTVFFEFDEVVMKFSADSINESPGFAAFAGFQKKVYPRRDDIVFSRQIFEDKKNEYREFFQKALLGPIFHSSRGISNPLTTSTLIECQVRNSFNEQHGIPIENSCYETSELAEKFEKENFGNKTCGISYGNPQQKINFAKIIGGDEANPGAWPWMASLRRSYHSPHYCGGVILSEKIVATAAHCINIGIPHYVVVGDHNSRSPNEEYERRIPVESFRSHPKFSILSFQNDVAIIRLTEEISFNTRIQAICLPPPGALPQISFETSKSTSVTGGCYISGWGKTNGKEKEGSEMLQEVKIDIHDDSFCMKKYGQRYDPKTMLCAGDGTKDACKGDSGGPIVCRLSDSHPWILYGIVSWGEGCGEGYPGVYAKVSSVINWLGNFGEVTKSTNVAKIAPDVQSVSEENDKCFVEIKESQQFGVIKNSEYPSSSSVNCTWIFEFKKEKKVKFLWDTIELSAGSRLAINILPDGDEQAQLFNETNQGAAFEIEGNFRMLIETFGFAKIFIRYTIEKILPDSVCNDERILTDSSGIIISPGFPLKHYENGLNCNWRIWAPLSHEIEVHFNVTALADADTCADKIQLYKGFRPQGQNTIGANVCGFAQPFSRLISSNLALVKFTSDWSSSSTGFMITYKIKPQEDSEHSLQKQISTQVFLRNLDCHPCNSTTHPIPSLNLHSSKPWILVSHTLDNPENCLGALISPNFGLFRDCRSLTVGQTTIHIGFEFLDFSIPGQFDIIAFWDLCDRLGNISRYKLVELSKKGGFEFNPCPICVGAPLNPAGGSLIFTNYENGEIQERNQTNSEPSVITTDSGKLIGIGEINEDFHGIDFLENLSVTF